MNHLIKLLFLILLTIPAYSQTPTEAKTVKVHGKNLYYEKYGKGSPLIFLHGYSLSSTHWKPYVSDFENDYEVYLIDLTGHGNSDPFREELSIKSVAQDLQVLIQHLQLKTIQAIGFSFGGDLLYQLALLQPDLIKSMITIGAVGSWDVNDFPKYLNGYKYENRDQFPWLKTSHKSDETIKGLMEQFQNYTVFLSDEELQKIDSEVMIMMGDDDEGMDIEEVARVRKNLPNSDLWILPNVSHGAHQEENKDEFVLKSKSFLQK